MTKIMFPEHRVIKGAEEESKNRSIFGWIKHLLFEIREIKSEIKEIKKQPVPPSSDYYSFVNKFRNVMRADIQMNVYPEVKVDGMRVGVTSGGLLYDKVTSRILPRELAFGIYERLYDLHQKEPLFTLKESKLCRTF